MTNRVGVNCKINQSMMFSSNPLDKSCINSDSCSSSRNNAPNRFSVGITPLGDENQHIRIQLAVHKYNGTTGSPFNNRCSFMSPIKHSFLKNSLKVRNHERDHEGTAKTDKTDKKNGNQYEGVGAFPTIHLKKNAVRYRPIKRFHDVKIPYPELPVSRFLSHLPEVCPDLKSSTRSVLDVLEDLSGNKIHSKDDSGCIKPKPQGLGGDYLLNPNAVFKPLFVQKPKLNTVLTRDNATQTLSPVSMETPSPQNTSSSYIRNGSSDSRAELRRKLAKQNNEIFASLSSSISSAFSLKRKIDKVLPCKDDDQLDEGSALKKTKILDHHSCEFNENGIAKSAITSTINSKESVKFNRKSKFSDTNSVSPNKDRLTTIFLDMRNTSPKARVFQANSSTKSKSIEKGSQVKSNCLSETNGKSVDKVKSPLAISFAGGKDKNESFQSSINFSSSDKSESCGSNKQEMEQSDKGVDSSLRSKSNTYTKDTSKSTSSTLELDVNAADTSDLGSPKTLIGRVSYSTETSKSAENGNELEKKENTSKDTSRGFIFGNSNDNSNFGSFKFGVDGSTSSAQNNVFTDLKRSAAQGASAGDSVASNSTARFSINTTSNVNILPLQTPALHFGVASSQTTLISPDKTTFTFGHTSSPSQQKSTDTDGKHGMSNKMPSSSSTTITATTQSTQPVIFTFGQKPNVSPAPANAKQDFLNPASHMSQSKTTSIVANFNKNSPSSTETSGPVLAVGQKPETSVTSAGPAAVIQEQIKTFPFTFGQKPDVGHNETQVESGQKSADVFSTEQKPVSQPSTQGSAVSTDVTASGQLSSTQVNQTLAQTVSPPTITPHVTFTQNSASQTSTTFGTKFEGSSVESITTPGFNSTNLVFPNKTLSFGSSVNAFGKTTAQTTTAFAASTSSAPAFGFEVPTTTRSVPTFGVSPALQSAPTFRPSSTTQSVSAFASAAPAAQTAPAFGASASHSTPGFVAAPTTQTPPTFGVSSAPHSTPTFGSSNKDSVPSFGTTSTTQTTSTFPGVSSQPSPSFGTSATTQTTFAAPIGYGLCSSQTTTIFGAPTSTQSPTRFGHTTTQNNTSFNPSTGFAAPPSTQPTTAFGTPTATSAPAFAASHSHDKPVACPNSPNIFVQDPSPSFSSTTAFASNQNNIFARKPNTETTMFEQNKLQTSGFGSTSQAFGSQNKFSFGMSTSNATGFTTSPPSTTAALVFSFGTSTTGNAFTFGTTSSSSNNTQAPFPFRSSSNEPFKFGATTTTAATTTMTTTKEGGTAFGGAGSASFNFSNQMSNAPVADQKPSFNFVSAQTSTAVPGFNFGTTPTPSVFNFGTTPSPPVFNFGTTPSPPVFNFGGSTSSANSGSNFNFGTQTGGVAFGQTASPGAPFAVPGTFSIGSGSSQSRPRASSRPRRRP